MPRFINQLLTGDAPDWLTYLAGAALIVALVLYAAISIYALLMGHWAITVVLLLVVPLMIGVRRAEGRPRD